MITKEATKYWKKAIKKDRVMVCRKEDIIYILNGYNAFMFPAMPWIWETFAQPAFMLDMPENNAAFQFLCGSKQWANAGDIINIIKRQLSDETPAIRSPFTFETKEGKNLRLYKNSNGSVSGIDTNYDAMVDHSHVETIYCGGRYSPVILKNNDITALIMPVRMDPCFQDQARDTFGKLI
jgi:hypothetical protein